MSDVFAITGFYPYTNIAVSMMLILVSVVAGFIAGKWGKE
jgi:hypothetical protein